MVIRMPHTPCTLRLLAGGALALLLISGCAAFDDDRSGIVVTTNILGDVTETIVGDQTDVTVLMQPNADPHSFGISAQQAAELEEAELVVYNGLGLEEEVLANVEAAADAGTPTLEVGAEAGPIDYTAGDSAGEPDPHFWTDPLRMIDAVDAITDSILDEVSGVEAGEVEANAADYRAEVEELHDYAEERFDEIPRDQRSLVTNHHVFGYLAERYDFEVIGAVVPSGTTLASPSSADLNSLAEAVTEAGVPAVFADSSQPDRLAEVMAEEADIEVEVVSLYSESLTEEGEGAETYLEMTRSNVDTITEGLTSE